MKKLLLMSLATSTMVLQGGTAVLAVEYPDATTANADATIEFEGRTPEVVDPTDPTSPLEPLEPGEPGGPEVNPNPDGAELMIYYASDFDFGTHSKSENQGIKAKADKSFKTPVAPLVSVFDDRGSDRDGWELSASISDFVNGKDILDGTEFTLSNIQTSAMGGQEVAPSIELNDKSQPIARANETQGIGNTSIGFGDLDENNLTDGVTLNFNGNQAINNGTYSAVVHYLLTADPAL